MENDPDEFALLTAAVLGKLGECIIKPGRRNS
jgi:hypothetical protein